MSGQINSQTSKIEKGEEKCTVDLKESNSNETSTARFSSLSRAEKSLTALTTKVIYDL